MSARKKPAKGRKDVPVDSEIRRAARRAGIRPKIALEDLKTALTQIADEKQAKRLADELKAATVAGGAPDPTTRSMFREGCGAENFRQAISRLLTGGLYVSRPRGTSARTTSWRAGHTPRCSTCASYRRASSRPPSRTATRRSMAAGSSPATGRSIATRSRGPISLNALSAFARDGRDLLDRLLCYEDFRYCDERKHPGRSFHRAGEESDKAAGGES